MMDEAQYLQGPRILEDGTNLDADFVGGHPEIKHRQIDDPVSDGSLGEGGYAPTQNNKDGGQI
jgi:hypothetical protein